ncbi:PP2C family protein-serine/threonine phosphatase [Streptomyces calidiresistens]|uniref:SpoIIE family protein phosphatase n=1 Tax=Streptomyces calidiresistens TaxID=1485586 RepID=A0A7W3T2K3_9ACTN|nr:SpoIIE family protein phosphatase [Streptomyces calidiresistens]MBB0229780.1 SpoIIE family protein phosphatase [Streptomyces calidiresistens]
MDRFTAVERALRNAPPHDLLAAARAALGRHYSATDIELLVADYGMNTLHPLGAPHYRSEVVSAHTGAPGRAFGSQQPYIPDAVGSEVATLHLPVTVRGDRIGVLILCLPTEECSDEVVAELREISEILGHEIVVAERDTDVYLQARRAERLTLAAEMQWQLLPGRALSRPEFDLGAQLEPAYAIHGDNFDWSTSADHLTLTVTNGMGEGIEAALLTNLAVNALRNARRAGLDLQDQAYMADQALYGQHGGRFHVSVLLLRFHLASGQVEIVDAGSPRMWRLRDGSAEPVELEAQLPLGMFEDTVYAVQRFRVLPGDRLLFVSDGVYDVSSPVGERYGDKALARALTSTRLLPPSQVPRAILGELAGYRGRPQSDDDAMILCLDWHGRPDSGDGGEPEGADTAGPVGR